MQSGAESNVFKTVVVNYYTLPDDIDDLDTSDSNGDGYTDDFLHTFYMSCSKY